MHTYTVHILGAIQVKVKYSDQQENLGLLVVAGSGPSLLWKRLAQQNSIELGKHLSDESIT